MITKLTYAQAVEKGIVQENLHYVETFCAYHGCISCSYERKRGRLYFTLKYTDVFDSPVTLVEHMPLKQTCQYLYTISHIFTRNNGVECTIDACDIISVQTYQTDENTIEIIIDVMGQDNKVFATLTVYKANKLLRLLEDFLPSLKQYQFAKDKKYHKHNKGA